MVTAWTQALGNVALVEFVALAFIALWRARHHKSRSAVRAATTFSVLGGIAVAGKLLTDFGPTVPPTWVVKVFVGALLAVPYCFYSFATAFAPPRRWMAWTARVLTLAVLVWTTLLPYFPIVGPMPAWYDRYRFGVGVQWAFLFTFVVIRLWVAAGRQPSGARARMRLLAAGALGLDAEIVLSVLGVTTHPSVALATQAGTVLMAGLFALGFTLPASVRTWSRRHDVNAIQDAIGDLVRASSTAEVADSLLPHVAAFVGATRVEWIDADGRVIAHHGEVPPPGSVRLSLGEGAHLVAWTNPYIQFFARDELRMLRGIGNLLAVVLERLSLVDREREARDQLVHQTLHDDLTGLPNRALFLDRLEKAVGAVERRRSLAAVMFIDLDQFKTINDGIDHAAGDAVLVETSTRLAAAVRAGDTVARFGGDEFVVCGEVRDEDEAITLANRLREAIVVPMTIDGRALSITASIGVVVASQLTDAAVLVRDADTAMYQAKDLGRDRVELFSEGIRTLARERLDLDRELRQAIAGSQIRLLYQPIFRLSDGVLTGFEALVRWQHPERGVLPPSRFIPLAEESGLIVALDSWVIHEAAEQAAAWRRGIHGLGDFTVWLNNSAGSFRRGNPVASVENALADTGLDPRALGIEITESVFMSGSARMAATIGGLKELGISLAIDDFGTGFSSLGYLKRFPVDVLKIDSSFVAGIGTEPETSLVEACLALAASLDIETVAEGVERNPKDAAITANLASLAHALDLVATAEGIESESQLASVRELGCDHAQGFLFAHPAPAEEISALLANPGRVADVSRPLRESA